MDTILGSYDRGNAWLLMEYIDRVKSDKYSTCLVTKPPTVERVDVVATSSENCVPQHGCDVVQDNGEHHFVAEKVKKGLSVDAISEMYPCCCETPWLTKFIMGVLIGVCDGSIDSKGLKARFVSLSVEFLHRCGVQYTPIPGTLKQVADHVSCFFSDMGEMVDNALFLPKLHEALAAISPAVNAYVQALRQEVEISDPSVDFSGLIRASRYGITMEGLAKRFSELSRFTDSFISVEDLSFWTSDIALTQTVLKVWFSLRLSVYISCICFFL